MNVETKIDLRTNETTLFAQSGAEITQSGVISDDNDARGIRKIGTGTLILSEDNTYGGDTNVIQGRLIITGSIDSEVVAVGAGTTLSAELTLGNAGSTGGAVSDTAAITLTNASNLTLGASERIGSLASTGTGSTVTLDANTLTVGNSTNTTVASSISGTGSLVKQGTGTLTLLGANTYSGVTTVSAGTLVAASNAALGAVVGGTTVNTGATLALQGGITTGEAITLNGTGVSGGGALRNLSGTNTVTGLVTLATDARINSDAGQLTISGGIGGADRNLTVGGTGRTVITSAIATVGGSLTVDATTTGVVALTGRNTFAGATNVASGVLNVSGGEALSDTGLTTVASGATLGVLANETVGSLAGGGAVALTGTLTTGDDTLTTYSGVASGAGGLTKAGAGTFTLTGANTYTGATQVSGGGLTLLGSGALASTNVTIDVGGTLTTQGGLAGGTDLVNNGTLALTGSETIGSLAGTGRVTLAANTLTTGGLNTTNTTLSGVVSGTGSLVKVGTGTQTLSGDNTATNLTVQDGTLLLTGNNAGVTSVTVGGGGGNATLRVEGTASRVGGQTITTLGSVISYGNLVNMATPIVLNSNTTQLEVLGANTAEQSGVISNFDATPRPIEKIGTGTLTLSGANTYTGATTVTAGVLNVAGSIASTDVVVQDLGGLIVDGASLLDGAAVTLNGGGNLTVNTATETIGSLAAAGTGSTVTLTAGLTVGNDTDTTVASSISGAGTLTKQGTGVMTLSGASTHSGALIVNDGTLALTGSIESPTVTINGNVGQIGILNVTNGGLDAGAAVTVAGGRLDISSVLDVVDSVALNGGGISGNAILNTGTFSQNTGTLSGTVSAGTSASLLGGTISGTLTGAAAEATAGVTNVTGSITSFDLNITGATVNVTGAGVIDVSGAGPIDVNAGGILTTDGATGGGGIADDDRVRMAGTAEFNVEGDETIAAIEGAGTVNLTGATLTTSGSFVTTFAGVMQGTGTGGLTTAGTNTLTLSNANTYIGATTVNDAANLILTGSIDSTLVTVNNNGDLILDNGDALLDTAAVVLNDNGEMVLANANSETIGSLEGASGSSLTLNCNTLTFGGNNTNTEMAGVITGAGGLTKVGGGTMTVSGDSSAYTGALTVDGGILELSGAVGSTDVTVNTNGTTFGTLNILADNVLDAANPTLTNNGIVNANNRTLSAFAFNNNLTFNARNAILTEPVTNTAAGVFDLSGGILTGAANNAGSFILSGGQVSGVFTNSGTLTALGASSVGGLTGPGTVSMLTPLPSSVLTSDRLDVVGNLNGGNFAMDVNLGAFDAVTNPNGGTADQIRVTGTVSGGLNFNFTNLVPAGTGPFLGGPILVLDGANAADSYTFTYSGLGAGGAVVYSLARQGADLNIISETSSGIGGIAANTSLIQSLISTVINRPTSPFVSGLATEEGCSRGGYFRGTYGVSTVRGTSNNGISDSNSTLKASYGGVQGGYDFGCNDGRFFDGWDGSFGAMLGYNTGKSDQDVSVPVGGGGTAVASVTQSEFDQKYIGVYAALSKDRLTTDVQLRIERTDFTLNERVNPGFFGLGLNNAKFSTNSVNFTGRVSYRLDINDEGLNFIPTGGLSYTRTSAANVNFAGGESLRTEGFDSIVGFVGGTLARTTISESGDSGTTLFGSANYYQDFAGDSKSVFTDSLGGTQNITTKNIGGFGELSMGVNYVRILENGPAGAKQLNANLRVDGRFGSNVTKAASITAQVRLSF
jgi:autotransporter-associated beta strand protein